MYIYCAVVWYYSIMRVLLQNILIYFYLRTLTDFCMLLSEHLSNVLYIHILLTIFKYIQIFKSNTQ